MSGPPSIPRASVWEWIQAALLALNLAWTTLCLGGYRPETMVVTSGLTGALLAVHLLSRTLDENLAATGAHPAGWWLLPFLAYAAANVLWVTPVRWLGWRDWFGWAEMIAVFWVVLNGVRSPAPRRSLFATLVALGVVVVGLGCYQRFVRPDWLMLHRVQPAQFRLRASGSFGIPNSCAAFLLLLIPALGALTFRRGAGAAARVGCGALTLILGFGLVLTISRGAWLGLALALVAWPLAAGRGRWRRRLGVAGGVLVALVLAGGLLGAALPQVRERFVYLVRDLGEKTRPVMWRAAWQLFREHPAVGSGAGSYGVLFEKYRPEKFPDEPQWAHNDYLNTLSDYGAVGFVCFFGAVFLVGRRCARDRGRVAADPPAAGWLESPAITAALAVGLLAFALQLLVDFHFKIPALAMACAVVAALVVPANRPMAAVARRARPARVLGAVGALAVVAVTACVVIPRFRGEALRYRAREALDRLAPMPDAASYRAALTPARADLARAAALDPSNAQTWADVAYATALWAHVESGHNAELGRAAEAAANRALALTGAVGEFWVRRGTARDMQARWLEGGADFGQAIVVCPQNAMTWYYYSYHLSLDPRQRSLTEAAVQFCLRLDPGNTPGLALRQHLAISPKAP